MAEEVKFIDKVKAFITLKAGWIVIALVVVIGYLVFRMKQKKVKLFGR